MECWEQARSEFPDLFNELGRMRPDKIVGDREMVQAYYKRGWEIIESRKTACMQIVPVTGHTILLCRECMLSIAGELESHV